MRSDNSQIPFDSDSSNNVNQPTDDQPTETTDNHPEQQDDPGQGPINQLCQGTVKENNRIPSLIVDMTFLQ